MTQQKYGTLLGPEIKIHRQYFREMCKLLGIYVLYRAPKAESKKYTNYAELDASYEEPILVGCIFDEHPTQQTLKKIGWISELQDSSSFIHVDYDLPGLQQGALFIIPSGLDDGKGRLFRVVKMVNSIVYPASMTCEIVPEYLSNFNDVTDYDYNPADMNILHEERVGPTAVISDDEFIMDAEYALKKEAEAEWENSFKLNQE